MEAAAIAAAQEAKRKKDEPLDSAAQSYMAWGKAIEDGKFDTQKYAEEMEKLSDETHNQEKTWWQKTGDWISDRLDDIVGAFKGQGDASKVKDLKFAELPDGKISVSANTPPGTRQAYRQTVAEVMESEADDFFAGTRYNPETVAARTSGGLLKSAISKGSLGLAAATSLASNLWTFGTNPDEGETFLERTVKNREFWVSTAVDFAVSVAVGVAAAAIVAGAIAGLVAIGVTAAATTPLWLTVGVTAGVAIGIGWGIDSLGIPTALKEWGNGLFKKP